MKKAFFLLLLTVIGISYTSCKDDEDTGGSGGATSITLTTNKETFNVGEYVTIFVVTNDGSNVTDDSEIKLESDVISKVYQLNTPGSYVLKASYNDLTSNEVNITVIPPPHVTSLSLTTDCLNKLVGEEFVFGIEATYSDDSVVNVSDEATILIDDLAIESNVFSSDSVNTFVVTATFDDVTSNELNIEVEANGARFQKYAVIEDYTGTWCGWCPRVAYGIELVENATNFAIPIAVHNGDSMANSFGSSLESSFGISGFPTAYLDRAVTWNYPEPNNVAQVTNRTTEPSRVGVSMEASLNGATINLDVNVKFGENFCNNDIFLTVFVLEDGIIENQANYTDYYGGVSTIVNFEHNHVLRHSLTSVTGDVIPSGQVVKGSVYSSNFSFSVPATVNNSNNISFVAIVSNSDKSVINARTIHINDSNNFEEL